MPQPLTILPGHKFSRLTVVRELAAEKTFRRFECICECGKMVQVKLMNLRSGCTKSCGCLKIEKAIEKCFVHGHSRSKLHAVWQSMKQRCNNENHPSFEYYGGRGIKVCESWLDFQSFREWAISNGYEEGLTLERERVNEGYNPSNCKWATMHEQCRNKRDNRNISFADRTMCLSDWAKELGLTFASLRKRLAKWPIERALTEPSKSNCTNAS